MEGCLSVIEEGLLSYSALNTAAFNDLGKFAMPSSCQKVLELKQAFAITAYLFSKFPIH